VGCDARTHGSGAEDGDFGDLTKVFGGTRHAEEITE